SPDTRISPPEGYLVADPVLVRRFRERLSEPGRAVVGVSWKSLRPDLADSKSAPLGELETVLRLSACRFVDLQYGDTSADRSALRRETGLTIEHLDDADNTTDLEPFAPLFP